MQATTNAITSEKIIRELGYQDPMDAARQQARMILLGRRAHYEAEIKKLEGKWQSSLDEMRARYQAIGNENFELDDDLLSWQWYAEAIERIDNQLAILSGE